MGAGTTAAASLRLERFGPGLAGGPSGTRADVRTAGWFAALAHGFYEKSRTPEAVASLVRAYAEDGRELTAVYDDAQPAAALGSAAGNVPVATYASLRKSLNVGGGRLLPAHLVTAVTVRTSHRRRGILSRMMAEDLARAAAEGLPVAALMASEATIYGRFGFGIATSAHKVHVDVRGGLDLAVPRRGSVVAVDPPALGELHARVFSRFHAGCPGSLDRQAGYRLRATGAWGEHDTEPNRALRAAVYLDEAGKPEGFVTYEFTGWDARPVAMRVNDLVAADATARLELWRYLGEQDLVERLEAGAAPLDDPLPLALRDPRRYAVRRREDWLWLRILDVPAALAARPWDGEGRAVLEVRDPLGLASGVYEVAAAGGEARVRRLPGGAAEAGAPDAVLDVAVLGSLYLGGPTVRSLHDAGRITVSSPEALGRVGALFDTVRTPYCNTAF